MARTYYAIQHTYGAKAGDERGDHIGELWVFRSKQARDAWVKQGNPYYTQGGARTAVSMTGSSADRRAIREFRLSADPYRGLDVHARDGETGNEVSARRWFAA